MIWILWPTNDLESLTNGPQDALIHGGGSRSEIMQAGFQIICEAIFYDPLALGSHINPGLMGDPEG